MLVDDMRIPPALVVLLVKAHLTNENALLFSIPTSSSYASNLTPPATTTGYAVKGVSRSNFTYGDVSFVPLGNINGTFYWTTNKLSSAITVPFNTIHLKQYLVLRLNVVLSPSCWLNAR
jgi:hypothetical protein